MDKISVIIPAYNEARHIEENLKEVINVFKGFNRRYEIIVIDDGSRDATYKRALRFSKKYPHIIVKRNMRNYGKGRALKKAVRFVSGRYTVFLDADMDLHPGQLRTFFDIMELDRADIVIGSKMHPNSSVAYPLHRKIMSLVYYVMIWIMFDLPVKDTQTGLKLFKTKVLKKVFPKITIKRFAFDIELLAVAHRMGYTVAEAPVILNSRRRWGRIGMGSVYVTLWDTLAVWYRMYMLHFYGRKR